MTVNSGVNDILKFKYEDFELSDYNPHPAIKGEISV
jgi:thymidylate synthase